MTHQGYSPLKHASRQQGNNVQMKSYDLSLLPVSKSNNTRANNYQQILMTKQQQQQINQSTSNLVVPTTTSIYYSSKDMGGQYQEVRILDGFMLLDASNAELPDYAMESRPVNKNINSVKKEDLQYFPALEYLDVSENRIDDLFLFAELPSLRELRLTYNRMRRVSAPPTGLPPHLCFSQLQYLDLSYNKISADSIVNLRWLPRLKELDLSANSMTTLPDNIAILVHVERLLLEHNRLTKAVTFLQLGKMPMLRHVSLAHNFLTNIPTSICDDVDDNNNVAFRLLSTLDLSFNYVAREADVAAISRMPRLTECMLYGNPLLGASGEDSLKVYVEELEELCAQARCGRIDRKIQILTEIPRKRVVRRGRQLGRQANYRDVAIISIAASHVETKSSHIWRAEGNFTLFAQAMQAAVEELKSSNNNNNNNSGKDRTFLTTVDDARNNRPANNSSSAAINKHPKDSKNATTSSNTTRRLTERELIIRDTQAKVDVVMSSVLSNMGLLDTDPDISAIQRRVDIGRNTTTHSAINDLNRYASHLSPPSQQQELPSQLFTRTLGDTQSVQYEPVAMKTAIAALRYSLDHPLTSHDEVPPSGQLASNDYARPTKASIVRKKLINTSALPHFTHTNKYNNYKNNDKNDSIAGGGTRQLSYTQRRSVLSAATLRRHHAGHFEPLEDLQLEETRRALTLDKVASVLSGLTKHTDSLVDHALTVNNNNNNNKDKINSSKLQHINNNNKRNNSSSTHDNNDDDDVDVDQPIINRQELSSIHPPREDCMMNKSNIVVDKNKKNNKKLSVAELDRLVNMIHSVVLSAEDGNDDD